MFTDFIFPEALTRPLGLKEATLRNCKSLVVLAGPNGAGKSRYLKLMPDIVRHAHVAQPQIKAIQEELRSIARLIQSEAHSIQNQHREQRKLNLEGELALLTAVDEGVHWDGPRPSTLKTIPLRYTLAETTFRGERGFLSHTGIGPYAVAPDAVEQQALASTENGFDGAAQSVPAYFHEVARALYDAEHPLQKKSESLKKRLEDAHAFNQVLEKFLGAKVEFNLDENGRPLAYFRGRVFRPDELSEGEQIIVIWTITLHRQKEHLRGAIVTIDEPENHLHPDACIRALDALRSDEILGPEGQIWLATHSVPLIAYAGLDSVHLVDNGSIQYAGNNIEKVINRLMGGENGRTRLRTLLADADDLAFETFAAQCLLPPTVAAPREDDPQQQQMTEAARDLGTKKDDLHILDYAAGRGRLAVSLREAGLAGGRKFTYFAYQSPAHTSEEERLECLARIRELGHQEPADSYLVNRLDRLCVPGRKPMDLVVMCNVLHEIPVQKWLECFEQVHEVLAEDGQLVILEDQLLPVGELPHAGGYIVLDDVALMCLFGSEKALLRYPTARDGRLTAYGISRDYLQRVSVETIVSALKKVRNKAKEELLVLRQAPTAQRSFQAGRRHAHYALLYTNAQLALAEYGEA